MRQEDSLGNNIQLPGMPPQVKVLKMQTIKRPSGPSPHYKGKDGSHNLGLSTHVYHLRSREIIDLVASVCRFDRLFVRTLVVSQIYLFGRTRHFFYVPLVILLLYFLCVCPIP